MKKWEDPTDTRSQTHDGLPIHFIRGFFFSFLFFCLHVAEEDMVGYGFVCAILLDCSLALFMRGMLFVRQIGTREERVDRHTLFKRHLLVDRQAFCFVASRNSHTLSLSLSINTSHFPFLNFFAHPFPSSTYLFPPYTSQSLLILFLLRPSFRLITFADQDLSLLPTQSTLSRLIPSSS